MKKLILILFCLPLILISQEFDDKDCRFKCKIQLNEYSGLFMCPYLSTKMINQLNKIKCCNIDKDDKNQTIIFELDSLYKRRDIELLFLNTIGIPKWSIKDIIMQ